MLIRIFFLLLALLGILILTGNPLVSYYTDYLWYKDLGFTKVFLIKFWIQAILGITAGLFAGAIFYINGIIVYKVASKNSSWSNIIDPRLRHWLSEKFLLFWKILAVLLALGFGLSAIIFWEDALLFFYAQPFKKLDPLLGLDLSFFIFRLPFLRYLTDYALGLWLVCASGGIILFVLFGHIKTGEKWPRLSITFRRYIALMAALFFLRLAFDLWLDRADLLFDERGVVFGAGFTEAKVVLPVLSALAFLSLIAAGLSAYFVMRPKKEILFGLLIAYSALYFIGLKLMPGFVHKYLVQPNELERERKYLTYEIKATREAFGLNNIDEKKFIFGPRLNNKILARNEDTIKNIRLWDHEPLLDTYSQIQEIRTYYKFISVDNDRYFLNGQLRQIMLSARELSYEDLPSRSWINEHLIYTHGYGLTLGVVNEVTEEGLPKLLIKDIPPVSECEIKISRPEIYFGELTNEYVIVDTKTKEFDYPAGESNVYTTYHGTTGVKVGGLFRRLLFSLRFGSSKIFLSSEITKKSRILYYRSIRDRVKRLIPFLEIDPDPYLVIGKDGRLFWFIDAYTTSNRYPYSRRIKDLGNYIRNSVLAVVDAYNGTVEFYLKDPEDPIILAYQKIFPKMFKPLSELQPDLRKHIRYPHFLFFIQAKLYGAYHMQNPRVFYNQEDLWDIPHSLKEQKRYMRPYYTIMKLPGEKKAEFILMIPFNPARKHNLAAWMCVRCDPEHYGQMLVYRFPKQKLVYGPQQIESRINQNPEISRQLSLWDQRGSRVILGTLLIIPVEGNLLYIQPLYLKAESGQIPELKRVIVAYENEIRMGRRLEDGLEEIFGKTVEKLLLPKKKKIISKPPSIKKLLDIYNEAQEALKRGDLESFGRAWRKIGNILEHLRE